MTRPVRENRVSADMLAEAMATRLNHVAEGTLLEFTQFQERSGLSIQAIHKQLQSGSLFTVDGPKGACYYPAFFADTTYDQAEVRRIARALKGLSGGSKWVFFTSPRPSLGGLTPLEVVSGATAKRHDFARSGGASVELPAVLRAAAGYVEE